MINSENGDARSDGRGAIARNSGAHESATASGRYVVSCIRADGGIRWQDEFQNLVTTAGKNDALDKYFSGAAYTATWYMGLIGGASYAAGPAAGDTSASHGGWSESTGYSQGTRPAASFAPASGGAKALSSVAVFSISADATIKGSFLINNSAKGGSTGILYSAGLFTGGDKVVQTGDTLNVSWTASL